MEKNMEKNIKLFPIYKLFSYDILFYYAISVMFFTQIKGLNLSQIALISTAYSASAILFQVPSSVIADRIGLKASMMLGNLLCVLWMVNVIFAPSFYILLAGELLCALGFALKGASETPFLYSTLKEYNKLDLLSKIESKGSTLYFVIEAVACAVSGYLFSINNYLPLIFAASCCFFAFLLSMFFTSTKKNYEKISIKRYTIEFKDGITFINKSMRLRALLLFSLIFYGVIILCNILMKSYFTTYELSATGFGYAYAIFAVCGAIGSRLQNKIEKRHRNKTLTFISVVYVVVLIHVGLLTFLKIPVTTLFNLAIISFSVQAALKGAYRIIIKQYVTRYTTTTIRSKLMSIYYLAENIGSVLFSLCASFMLTQVSIGIGCVVSGCALLLVLLLVMLYMQPRLGKKPESYTSRDRYDLKEQEITEALDTHRDNL